MTPDCRIGAMRCLDATCPFVAKDPSAIVSEASRQDNAVTSIARRCQPSRGIRAICGPLSGVSSYTVFQTAGRSGYKNCGKKLQNCDQNSGHLLVAQTTFNAKGVGKLRRNGEKSVYKAREYLLQYVVLRLDGKRKRVSSAAGKPRIMIVVGGRHSSNTVKAAMIYVSGICAPLF